MAKRLIYYPRQFYRGRCLIMLFSFCFLPLLFAFYGAASGDDGVLDDPVVLGAWLYKANCVRCHGDYERDRPAQEYENVKVLKNAFGNGKCRVRWARRVGGEFGNKELEAVAKFMLKWEEGGQEPDLPELPPLPVQKIEQPVRKQGQKQDYVLEKHEETLDPILQKVVDKDPIFMGGWLFTKNCYRCHLSYRHARMGKGVDPEIVRRTITEGKTSTQMRPFARILGGTLKNNEIQAIVSYIKAWEAAGEDLAIATVLMTPPATDPAEFEPIRLPRFIEVAGDPRIGRALYVKSCSRCHGAGGEGYIGSSLRSTKWVIRKDLFFKSVVKQGVPSSLMVSQDKNKGGRLTAKDVDDVVSYLVSLQNR